MYPQKFGMPMVESSWVHVMNAVIGIFAAPYMKIIVTRARNFDPDGIIRLSTFIVLLVTLLSFRREQMKALKETTENVFYLIFIF